jgi:atypical dual specificity phosphatase
MSPGLAALFPAAKGAAPEYNGPTNFKWLVPGVLGGCPRPGIFRDIALDLEALRRVGTNVLVTLTREWPPDTVAIKAAGLRSIYLPIVDLQPPTVAQALETCAQVQAEIRRGRAVVFHCHAGHGRTGTLLAAMLVYNGMSARNAVLATRGQHPKWIETDSQIDFLHTFSDSC